MDLWQYIRPRVWEIIFCMVAASSLCYALCGIFYASFDFQKEPLALIADSCLFILILFVISCDRTMALVGGVIVGCGVVVAFLVLGSLSPGPTPLADVRGNNVYFLIMLVIGSLIVFLLSRTRGGTITLLGAGTFIFAFIEYLNWSVSVAALAAFLVAVFCMLVYKAHVDSIGYSATDARSSSALSVIAIVLSAIAIAAAAGIFYAIVEPLDPPHVVIERPAGSRDSDVGRDFSLGPFLDQRAYEESGTGDVEDVDGIESAKSIEDDPNARPLPVDVMVEDDNMAQKVPGDLSVENNNEKPSAPEDHLYLILAVALGLAVIAFALLAMRAHMRKLRFNRLIDHDNAKTVCRLYAYFLKQFAKLGVECPKGMTPLEFVDGFAQQLLAFEQKTSGDPQFRELTRAYVRASYGKERLYSGDVELFRGYFAGFYRNARRYAGIKRYLKAWVFL